MKSLKRFLILAALLALLIGCLAFSVSAEPEDVTISVVYNGVTYSYSYGSEIQSFEDLMYLDQDYIHPVLGQTRWGLDDGYIVMSLIDSHSGKVLKYRLSQKENAESEYFTFVVSGDDLISDEPYSLSVSIGLDIGGGDIKTFNLPSYVVTWDDLIMIDQDYIHPELGNCRWSTHNGFVCMDVSDGSALRRYFPMDVYGSNLSPNDNLFENDVTYNWWPCSKYCIHDNHVLESEILVLPTCTTTGQERWFCTVCDYEKTVELSTLDHSYVNKVLRNEPTCLEPGLVRYQCSGCTATKDEPLPAIGHSYMFAEEIKAPTCTESGICAEVCNLCFVERECVVSALGHDRNVLGTCRRCGNNYFLGDSQEGSSGSNQDGGSGSEPDGGGGNDSNSLSKLWSWCVEQFNKIKDALGSGKDEAEKLGDTVLTIVFLFVGALLIPLLWPLIKAIIEGLTFAVQTVVSLCKKAFSSLSANGKNRKNKGKNNGW